jgi:iron complex outermembrane receptor protein
MRQRAPLFSSPALACVGSLFLAGPLPAATVPRSAETSELKLEEIIVTGTRLPIALIDMFSPVTVLNRTDIERGGANSVGDVLQSLPMNAGSPLNTNVNVGGGEPGTGGAQGDGSVRVALHGHSTLVLLNGRRFPNSGLGADASVDLNTLPMSWIDRVEV